MCHGSLVGMEMETPLPPNFYFMILFLTLVLKTFGGSPFRLYMLCVFSLILTAPNIQLLTFGIGSSKKKKYVSRNAWWK